jgi:AcrR family transcriptional regulator
MNAAAGCAPESAADARRRALLEAALAVFARHGYKKASMDEVAHAAGVSRQGLYLHFQSKEDLFRAAVAHALQRSQAAVAAVVEAPAGSVEDKLVGAFDEWVGQFVDAVGADVDDLVDACRVLLGPVVEEHAAQFAARIATLLDSSGVAAAYAPLDITAQQLATLLCATADGLKAKRTTRQAFVDGMRVAVRALCGPMVHRR